MRNVLSRALRLFILIQIGFVLGTGINLAHRAWLGEDGKKFTYIHPDVLNHVLGFIILSATIDDVKKIEWLHNNMKTLTIGFYNEDGKDKSQTLAYCDLWANEIGINLAYWKDLSKGQQMALVWHELGHCSMKKPHTDYGSDRWENIMLWLGFIPRAGRFDDNCPKSLMHPYGISNWCLNKYSDHYILDLFTY